MKLSRFATSAFVAAIASAESVVISVQADGNMLGYLSSRHEGAGINYFFVGEKGQALTYDAATKALTAEEGSFTAHFGSIGPYLALGPAVTPQALFG